LIELGFIEDLIVNKFREKILNWKCSHDIYFWL